MKNNSTFGPNVRPFDFEGSSVRTSLLGDQAWFVAADVCRALGLTNPSESLRNLDADEKGVSLTDTPSGAQDMLIISESGLYTLILRCRDAVRPGTTPHRFRRWVTTEVLPSIRRHGRYIGGSEKIHDLVGSVIGSTGLIVLDRVIDQKAQAVDKGMRRSFKHTMKSRLRNRFNVQRTDLIPADELADACNFVAAYTLEGEYLGKEPEKARLDIHFPIDALTSCGRKGMRQPRNANTDFLNVALSDLRELHSSPCEEVLNILHNAGYNVEGAWWELRTYRNKLAYLMPLIESMASLAAEPHEYVVDKAP